MKRILISLALFLGASAIVSFAATKEQMQEAQAKAAKLYLRYCNNGAGYLDDVNVKDLASLEGKLNNKTDRDNLAAFKKVQLPTDYASWDATRLAEYWSKDVFSGAGALANPKQGEGEMKNRIRKQIAKMTVTVETVKAAPAETPTPAAANAPVSVADDGAAATPAETAVEENVVAPVEVPDSMAAAPIPVKEDGRTSGSRNLTWLYVALLVLILGVAGWLIYYAAKVMKSQNARNSDDDEEEGYGGSSVEDPEAVVALNAENARLKSELAAMREKLERVKTELVAAEAAKETAERMAADVAQSRQQREEPLFPQPEDKPHRQAVAERGADNAASRVIYLGRVNQNGIFVRADKDYNPSATLFRMVTTDGYSGSFYFMDDPNAVALAFSNPRRMLENGCIVSDVENTDGFTGIQTISSGTAVFESGCWKVIRKAKIQYV